MLKESALVPNNDVGRNTGGFHLGPVGGRIVGEVVIGLLQSDPASYVAKQPLWTPTLQNPGTGFRMVDFLTFAGVDPATRRAQKPTNAEVCGCKVSGRFVDRTKVRLDRGSAKARQCVS